MNPYEQARAAELVARACRVLGKLGMTHGALGHVSHRLDGDRMLIKGKGALEVGMRFTQPKDVIEIDFNGDPVYPVDGLRAPSECFIHIQIMKMHPEVNSAVHCHPAHAVLMTAVERDMIPIYAPGRPGARIPLQGLPIYPRSHGITTPERGDALIKAMGPSKAVVMQAHGIAVYGSDVKDATVTALALNEYLTMLYKSYALGQPRPVPAEDIPEMGGPPVPSRGTVAGRSLVLSEWRYYCGLADEDPD